MTATGGVVANMATPGDNTGDAAGDSYRSILGLVGSRFHDVLTLGNTAGSIWAHPDDDTLVGGAGNSLQFAHYGTTAEGATFTQVDATHWSVNSADGQVQDIVTFANAAAIDVSDYLFV